MIKLGSLALDGTPRIAVPFRDSHDDAFIREAIQSGADIAELRIDEFKDLAAAHVMEQTRRYDPLPVLATIRSAAEGGAWRGAEQERLSLFEAVIPLVDGVDIELSSVAIRDRVVRAAGDSGKCVIISYHNFERRPSTATLQDIARQAKEAAADIVKIAVMCHSMDDARALARFTLDHSDMGVVVIGMGSAGTITRLLFPALGSLFTFAAHGQETAPGQLPLAEMACLFRAIYRA
ncbi:MAG: 3-dehydroquinate dehydratase [Candidatus Hydrogenedentota bacterium]